MGWGQDSLGLVIAIPFPELTGSDESGLILNMPLSDDTLIVSAELLYMVVS